MNKIGIDLGGTKIEGILLNENFEKIERKRIPTNQDQGYDSILNSISELIQDLRAKSNAETSIGICTPGVLSKNTGLLKNSNTQCLIGKPLKTDLEKILEQKISMENDANCFTRAEATFGAGKNFDVVFGVIIGTGVGGGIAIRKKIHTGRTNIAGEWGHITLGWMSPEEYPGEECYCGKRGCLETFVSGTGFENEYERQTGNRISGHKIIKLLEKGDDTAEKVMRTYENRLARGIATLANFLDPDVLVLGGGMSNISRIYQNLPALIVDWVFGNEFTTPIRPARHGDSSGVRGAAWLW